MRSLDCLAPKGMMVSFGQSSGPVGPVDLMIFGQKGSLFFTRPSLNTYAAKRSDLWRWQRIYSTSCSRVQ